MNEEVNRFVNEVNNGNSQEAIRLLYSLQRRRTPMKLSLKAEMSSGCKGNKLEMIKELIEVYKIEIGMAKWAVSKSSSVEEALSIIFNQ